MTNKGTNSLMKGQRSSLFLMVFGVIMLSGNASLATQQMTLANGITATIHEAQEISAQLVPTDKGILTLTHPALGSVEMRNDAASHTPFSSQQVLNALEDMRGFNTAVSVDVFILPVTPVATGGSFARRGAIVLAPGTGLVDAMVQANITTHEMGHVLTWAFLDDHPSRWNSYLALRGLDQNTNGPAASHADRAREILAEDIRFLFGGSLATVGGSIENHNLSTPDRVIGLEELLASFFAPENQGPVAVHSAAFPNPCNPLTTIEMSLPAGFAAQGVTAELRIYDVRGAVVRTVSGGYLANSRVSLQWDGSTDQGTVAASGRYFYSLRMGSLVGRGSVTMVR